MVEWLKLHTKIFADGADMVSVRRLSRNARIEGFTTNPTLMRSAGVEDYEQFAREFLSEVTDRPVSFEVFSDEPREMEEQALKISAWADNVYVKIPVTTTTGDPTEGVVRRLVERGVKVNVTALMTVNQVEVVASWLEGSAPSYVSVFGGRIADTGRDPVPVMKASLDVLRTVENAELIWASPREVLNVIQADAIRCDIITLTHDLLAKLPVIGRDLTEFSLDTVRMFHSDARAAAYRI